MKPIEIRDLDSEELLIRIAELKEELFNLRFQRATGQLDNHRRMPQVRSDIARMKTILREREIEAYFRLQEQEASAGFTDATQESEATEVEAR